MLQCTHPQRTDRERFRLLAIDSKAKGGKGAVKGLELSWQLD